MNNSWTTAWTKAGELMSMRNGQSALGFFTDKYVLSNHHPVDFQWCGRQFFTSEQYYMWQRARFLGNEKAAARILATRNPREAKDIGKNLPEMKIAENRARWHEVRLRFMTEALLLKFNFNTAHGKRWLELMTSP